MPFGTWWRGDPLPDLSSVPGFAARISTDIPLISRLNDLDAEAINVRFQNGHHCYICFVGEVPVAYGWVATLQGAIEAFQFSFSIPPHNRYLWNFMTLPEWRGQGIYPCFLQSIIRQEQAVQRFWIGYEPGNEASAHGINKAGFHVVCDLIISEGRVSGLTLFNSSRYAWESTHFFQLPGKLTEI